MRVIALRILPALVVAAAFPLAAATPALAAGWLPGGADLGARGCLMLDPGTYQAHLRARDAAGSRCRMVTLTFAIVRHR